MFDLDEYLNDSVNEGREYEKDIIPVDIGKWESYMPYHNPDQLALQLESLQKLPIHNHYGNISFILSKNIDRYEKYLQEISSKISITNTETVLETEVYYTSKIEGAKTTRKRTFEIHNGSPISEDNKFSEAMIKGNFEAVKLLNLYGNRIDKEILYKTWDVLTTNCRENADIQGNITKGEYYRIGEVGVTNSDFISVHPTDLDEKMDELINFYNSDILNEHPFVKACIIHLTFETIHPFCDGNGRLGRLLMNNFLISQGIESCRAVSFSEQIDKNRGLYDGAFTDSENKYGDCTPFIEYMLETMSKAYMTAANVN